MAHAYHIALIGAGRMGSRWAEVIAAHPRAKLSLVVDRDASRGSLLAQKHGARFSTDVRAAWEPDIQAVCIATPHVFLHPLAQKSLKAGKHVFVEKPGATGAREMRNLLKESVRQKRALMVGFNYRFFDSLEKAKKLVEEGTLGEVYGISIRHGHPGRIGYEKEWRMNKKVAGGGVLMDQGLHVIDLAQWFLEDPVAHTSASLSNRAWKTSVEDTALILLQTKHNKYAMLEVSVAEPFPVFSLEVRGEKGSLVVPGLGRRYGDGETLILRRFDRKKGTVAERSISCNPDADRALRKEFEAFLALMNGKKRGNAVDAAAVLSVIEKVYTQSR